MPQRPWPALKGQYPPAMGIAHRLKYTNQIAMKGRHISRSGKSTGRKYSSAGITILAKRVRFSATL
jgi:hypothetical protein